MADPTDVMDASHQVFVLAFDLVESEAGKLPDQLAQTLASAPVQDAIRKTLLDFLNTKGVTAGAGFSGDDAAKLAGALQKNVSDPASTAFLNQVKNTPEYKRLEASLDAFKKATESSTLGVWVDENKTILYVVGAALVVGAGTVLYVTKTGGSALNMALDPLKGKSFQVLHIGALTLKADLWDFKPDARVIGAHVVSSLKWDKVQIDVKIGILAQGAQIQQAQGEAVVKSGPVSLSFTADAKPQTQLVNLGLKVGYQAGRVNLALGAAYQDKLMTGTASVGYKTDHAIFGLQANVGEQKAGGMQYGALLTVTFPVH